MKDYKTSNYSNKNYNLNLKDTVSNKGNKINSLIKEIKNEHLTHKEYSHCLVDLRKKMNGEKDRSIVYLDKIDCIHFMKKVKTGKYQNLFKSYSKKEMFTNHSINDIKVSKKYFNNESNISFKTSRINHLKESKIKYEYTPVFNKRKDSVDLYRKNLN